MTGLKAVLRSMVIDAFIVLTTKLAEQRAGEAGRQPSWLRGPAALSSFPANLRGGD